MSQSRQWKHKAGGLAFLVCAGMLMHAPVYAQEAQTGDAMEMSLSQREQLLMIGAKGQSARLADATAQFYTDYQAQQNARKKAKKEQEQVQQQPPAQTQTASLNTSQAKTDIPEKTTSLDSDVNVDTVQPVQKDTKSDLQEFDADPIAVPTESDQTDSNWTGPVLTRSAGVNYGPTGKETYYNLPMQGVISIMRNAGFAEEDYPYWVREDGVKMLGDYVMVAANLQTHPRGSVVETSLGQGLVCDTGGFASMPEGAHWLDIAVNW